MARGGRLRPEASELYFEELGGDFDRWMSRYDVERRIALLERLLPAGVRFERILEVGCGTGAISRTLLRLGGALTVADVSEQLAKKVGEELGAEWTAQDACAMTLKSDSYDLVISSECIEHTADPEQALREMARVTKPGGWLIVTSPNKLWYPVLLVSELTGLRKFAGNERWLFPGRAVRLLEEADLEQLTVRGCHLFPWQIPGAKRVLPLFERWDRALHPLMINYGVAGRRRIR